MNIDCNPLFSYPPALGLGTPSESAELACQHAEIARYLRFNKNIGIWYSKEWCSLHMFPSQTLASASRFLHDARL